MNSFKALPGKIKTELTADSNKQIPGIEQTRVTWSRHTTDREQAKHYCAIKKVSEFDAFFPVPLQVNKLAGNAVHQKVSWHGIEQKAIKARVEPDTLPFD